MKINQPTKHPAGDDTPTSEMTDSPRNYAHRRKTRGARKHAGEMPARVSTLRDTLKAQGLAGKQDSAEAYAALFAPAAKVSMKPSAPVAALRPEDYDVEALVAMSDSQFATIDFSQPERPVDMSEWQLSSASAPPTRAGRTRAHGAAPVSNDEFEYVAQIEMEPPRRLSDKGAAILGRMSDEELAGCDVTDYFEPVARRRSIDAPATESRTS